MKIITSKDNLFYAVQIVQRAVSLKNPLPILSGILLKTENNLLKLIATDLEIGFECSIPVTVVEEGSIVLPAKYFTEIVRKLPDTKIEIETADDTSTNIKYGTSLFTIKNFAVEDFPQVTFNKEASSFKIKQSLFKNMIKQVVFATSNDETRPIFTGVLLETVDSEIRLVASDTHRLALRKAMLTDNYDALKVIIPGRALNELSKILDDDDADLVVSINENQVLFQKDNIKLTSRLIHGQFPNYNQIIPQNFSSHVKTKNKDMLESIERAALVAREINNAVKISIEDNNIQVSSNSPEIGQVEENLPCYLNGEPTQIAFNSKYLIDAFKVIEGEEIEISLTGSLSPGIIKPNSNNNYIYLILPVRTN